MSFLAMFPVVLCNSRFKTPVISPVLEAGLGCNRARSGWVRKCCLGILAADIIIMAQAAASCFLQLMQGVRELVQSVPVVPVLPGICQICTR